MQESYFSPYTRVHGFAKPLEDNDLHMKTKTHKLQCVDLSGFLNSEMDTKNCWHKKIQIYGI